MDTGSDINLVKHSSLREPENLDIYKTVNILGITGDKTQTLGTCFLQFRNNHHEFHATDLPMPDECDGIIETAFLNNEQAEISFHHHTLVTKNNTIRPIPFYPFFQHKDYKQVYMIKARTRRPVRVPVSNPEIKEGILNKVELLPGIHLGNAAVKNEEGTCLAFVINTMNEDLEVYILPQHTEPFEEDDDTVDFRDFPYPENPVDPNRDRVEEIKDGLRLDHLIPDEKESILEIIEEFPEVFYLQDEPLPATNICKHKIPTTDEIPINTRQVSTDTPRGNKNSS